MDRGTLVVPACILSALKNEASSCKNREAGQHEMYTLNSWADDSKSRKFANCRQSDVHGRLRYVVHCSG